MSLQQIESYVCGACGWADFHPVGKCPRCHGEINPETLPGKGRIVTYTEIRYPPSGFENKAPYVVAIIDIEHGPRVIGRISNPVKELKTGAAVSLVSAKENVLEFLLST